jgi:hypothetical protein
MVNPTSDDHHVDTHTRELRKRVVSASERRPRSTISPVTATLAAMSFLVALVLVSLYLQS